MHSLLFLAIAGLVAADPDIASRLKTTLATQPCYRVVGVDADVGCSTGASGSSGLLFSVESAADVAAFEAVEDGAARAAVVAPSMFTSATVDRLAAAGGGERLAGILVVNSSASAAPLEANSPASPTTSFPNAGTGHVWNPAGQSFLGRRFSFPIVSLESSTATDVLAKARSNVAQGSSPRAKYPQWATQFFFEMGPASLRSDTCLTDASCLPLGGQSVWATVGEVRSAGPGSKPLVVVTGTLDANSLFHDRAMGGDTTVSALVAIVAASDALSKVADEVVQLPLQPLFALFGAESWGRVGSRRWLLEVASFACARLVNATGSRAAFCRNPLRYDLAFQNVSLANLHTVLAVDQVGRVTGGDGAGAASWFLHTPTPITGGPAQPLLEVLSAVATSLPRPTGITSASVGPSSVTPAAIPPTSPLQSFVEAVPTLGRVGVLAAYDSTFTNPFYQSHWDGRANVQTSDVVASATLLARSVFALSTGIADASAAAAAVPASLAANATLVEELLDCFLADSTCPLFQTLLGTSQEVLAAVTGGGPLSLYTSVYSQPYMSGGSVVLSPSVVEEVARVLLASATATTNSTGGRCATTADCRRANADDDGSSSGGGDDDGADLLGATGVECILGRCLVPTAHFHDAISPALEVNGYLVFSVNASRLTDFDPVWAEPYWSAGVGVTLFQESGPGESITAFVIGLLLTGVTGWLTFSLNEFARRKFKIA